MSYSDMEEVENLKEQKKRLFEELSALKFNSRRWRKTFKMYLHCFETIKLYQR